MDNTNEASLWAVAITGEVTKREGRGRAVNARVVMARSYEEAVGIGVCAFHFDYDGYVRDVVAAARKIKTELESDIGQYPADSIRFVRMPTWP